MASLSFTKNRQERSKIVSFGRAKANKSSAVAEMGDCLATIDMGRKEEAVVPLSWGELGPHLTMWPGPRPIGAYLHTKWHLDTSSRLATTDMGRKLWTVPLFVGAGSPSDTVCPRPRPTTMPSFILIHPTVWSQRTLYVCFASCLLVVSRLTRAQQ